MLTVVLRARGRFSGVLQCHVMYEVNGFRLCGSSPVPALYSLSQTEWVGFPCICATLKT